MTPDYDLSDLAKYQADLWLYLHTDAIRAQIFLDQATSEDSGHSQPRPAFKDSPQTKIPKRPVEVPGTFSWEN